MSGDAAQDPLDREAGGEPPASDPPGAGSAEGSGESGFPEVDDPEAARADALAAEPGGVRGVTEVRKPSTIGGMVYLGVLGGALAGIGVAATGAWRNGVSWLAIALIAAAAARLVLPDPDAGMLRVRSKLLDVVILVGTGIALLSLVATIPNQPG
ncbi:DUF3017 domain-containing protein [Nocardioides donggukensis]|nr:DUF3017 domain-containing protein [Nocardioides donggukensis]